MGQNHATFPRGCFASFFSLPLTANSRCLPRAILSYRPVPLCLSSLGLFFFLSFSLWVFFLFLPPFLQNSIFFFFSRPSSRASFYPSAWKCRALRQEYAIPTCLRRAYHFERNSFPSCHPTANEKIKESNVDDD